jgi:type IV secretion system protein VirD4
MDPDFRNNIILTQTERLTMNSRPKDPKTARNKNVLVIGGSGSGKTRFFVKPQLMQLHSSYVVTDPKGSLLVECGRLMERAGYKIKVFNTINFKKSMHYNPFAYIHSEKDTQKTVLFLIMSDTDSTFNFLISMIYSQLFNLLCEKADDEFGGRLPIHVRCLIDECANIGQIPNLEKLMATIRSREISACLVLQAQSQLKALYKDSADTIIGNCDTSLFLGGKEPTTLKELNQTLGKETIDTFNTGESRGREVSHSLNYQKLGKDLATVDELAVLDGGKCILQLRGVRPFLSDKYDITKHPNYKYLSDADKRNEFDIERFLSRRLKPKPDEVYDVYDIDASVMDAGETAGG